MNFKVKKVLCISTMFLATFAITSCGLIMQAVDTIANDITDIAYEVKNDNVTPNQPLDFNKIENETVTARFDYDYVSYNGNNCPTTPNIGDVNILVIPVELSDEFGMLDTTPHFTPKKLASIKASFNGTKEDDSNNYRESVKSFYEKSSYGNLHLNFDVLDVYKSSMSKSEFEHLIDDNGTEVTTLLDEIYANKNSLKLDGSFVDITDSNRYDANYDGYIDGVWLIYNVFDSNEVTSSKYWAYTANYFGDLYNNPDVSSIVFGKYANFAYAFLNAGNSEGLDAHTAIHETGHMFGLDDYYSYDLDADKFGQMGGVDMMDNNVGDQSAFSKFSLGWVNPTVVYKDCEITLRPFESSGDCVILPANYFNDSAFSEYLIIEYYTPTGLNKLDSSYQYRGSYPRVFTEKGILIYHVDARIGEFTVKNNNLTFKNFISKDTSTISIPTTSHPYYSIVTNSNTPSFNYVNETFSLVQMMSSNGRQIYGSSTCAKNSDLFKAGDVFNKSKAKRYFANDSFNDGTALCYTVNVESLTTGEATIRITR